MKIQFSKEVVWTKLGDEVAILNSETGTYFGLDPVGSRIWCLMAEGAAVDEVVSTLLSEYGVDEQLVRNDLRELVEQLAARSLLKISNDEDSPD
jgi:Coenzyme PQQ synthesis protein D (PqqD)